MAPSTPPPPASMALAALAIASVVAWVMSSRASSKVPLGRAKRSIATAYTTPRIARELTSAAFRSRVAPALGLSHTRPVPGDALYDELCRLLGDCGVEVRVEPFQKPSERGGGLCVVRGKRLVILDQGASRAERARALIEALEHLEVVGARLREAALSAELRRQLNRRGHMPWPSLRQAPGLARCEP